MKNILGLLLRRTTQVTGMALVTLIISACGAPEGMDALDVHYGTMNEFDTYTIHYEEIRVDSEFFYTSDIYVYVDNMTKGFIVSDEEKNTVTLGNEDYLFEESDNSVYGYTNQDVWLRYEVDSDLLNVKNFERSFFYYVESGTIEKENEIVKYTKVLSVDDLSDNYVNLLGVDIPTKYENIDFTMTAMYSLIENRFVDFKMDFTPILEAMSDDIDKELPNGSKWEVNIDFNDVDRAYSINAPAFIEDDYINDFSLNSLIDITTKHSYELFEGSVNYGEDQDVFSLIVDASELYKIFVRDVTNSIGLNIKILDSHFNVFKEITIDGNSQESSYYSFDRGEYYLVVTSDTDNCEGADYSFLFLTH